MEKNSMYNTFETYFVCNAQKRICFVTATMELFLIDHFSEEKLLNYTFFSDFRALCVFLEKHMQMRRKLCHNYLLQTFNVHNH